MTEAEYIKYETDKARPAPETEAEDWRPCVKVRGPEGESRWIGITPLQFQDDGELPHGRRAPWGGRIMTDIYSSIMSAASSSPT